MFLLVALSIWILMHVYVLWRASSIPFVAERLPRFLIFGGGALLGSCYVLARLVEGTRFGILARPFEFAGAMWMGVLLLALTCLLIVDLFTAFGWLLPRLAPRLRGWALLTAGLLSAIAFVQALRPPVVREHEIDLPGLPAELDGTVLVFISDLHLGTMLGNDWLEARIREIDALRPDLVVIGGDVFEGDSAMEREMLPTLRSLRAPRGVFAVAGNHDGHLRGLIDEVGFQVLRNRWVEAAPGLVVAGVGEGGFQRELPSPGPSPIERALSGRPQGAGTVFVTHVPAGAEAAARLGAGLMLAGHTHGGQVWPFSVIVQMVTPLFVGRYDVGGMAVIVCRGTGTFGPRMRLWQPSEILRVTLKSPRGRVQAG